MSGAANASGVKGVEFRRKWDKEEYADKAKKKDEEEKDRMKENEERLKQGALDHRLHTFVSCLTQYIPKESDLGRLAKMISPNRPSS